MSKQIGTGFDDFLEEEGIREEVEAAAMKRVLSWQFKQAMDAHHLSIAEMARRMRTSRTQVSRLLDARDTGVTLATLAKASQAVGLHLRLALEE